MPQDNFVAPEKYHVISPYSDLEKMMYVVERLEKIEKNQARLDEQYAAIRGMFSECLEVVREIRDWVRD